MKWTICRSFCVTRRPLCSSRWQGPITSLTARLVPSFGEDQPWGPETSFPSLHFRLKLSCHRARGGGSETAAEGGGVVVRGWGREACRGAQHPPQRKEGRALFCSQKQKRQVVGWLRPVLKQRVPRQDQGSELLADLKAWPRHSLRVLSPHWRDSFSASHPPCLSPDSAHP